LNVLPPDYSPSIRFCLPNKLFEYLMAGIPVLTSPLDSVVELITAYDVGAVVYSMKPHDIAQAIVGMLADPARLARMRAHALAACARDLRWDVERLRLLSLYQSILASDRA
jgi:glycosyltransferase involved in cell wall biosynthesis